MENWVKKILLLTLNLKLWQVIFIVFAIACLYVTAIVFVEEVKFHPMNLVKSILFFIILGTGAVVYKFIGNYLEKKKNQTEDTPKK